MGQPPGGGADVYARLVQRHLPRHIPGQPAIVVQNMPGAGSLNSVTWLDSTAPADGTAMTIFNSELLDEAVTAPDRVNVDFRRFNWIGNVSEDMQGLFRLGGERHCRLAGVAGPRASAVLGRNGCGHRGQRRCRHAAAACSVSASCRCRVMPARPTNVWRVERREIDGDCGGWTTIPPDWLRDRQDQYRRAAFAIARARHGCRDTVRRRSCENDRERKLYDFLVAPERLGRLLVMSGKVPADRVAVLRTAFDAMIADPAFRAEATRLNLL